MLKRFLENKRIDRDGIKLIAIIAMTIDHLTWVFFPGFNRTWYVILLHVIGRLTAPIMWFFIAEGFHYTRDVKKYLIRLFLFSVVSHFAYDFAFGIPFLPLSTGVFNQTSVLWSLAWAVTLLAIERKYQPPMWAMLLCIFAVCVIAFPSDWSSIAVMAPYFLYHHRGDLKKQALTILLWSAVYAAVYFFFIDKGYGLLQLCTVLCVPVLAQYNGKRGKIPGMKWLFYFYYPAHLVLIGILRLIVQGDVPILF